MPKISLDDVEFNSEDLTEDDQRIFASLQFVEAKITSLKNERSVLNASKLFYEDLTAFLISLGFQLNPFDHCVANKLVNGKQLTVTWHVDDLKILIHRQPARQWGILGNHYCAGVTFLANLDICFL